MDPLIYREHLLHPLLVEWVTCAWYYERDFSAGDDIEEVIPDGFVELTIQLGAPYRDGDRRLPECVAIGTLHRPLTLRARGRVRQWSLRFPWWAVAPFGDVRAFAGRPWAPALEVFDASLIDAVQAAARTEGPVTAFERVLLTHVLEWSGGPDSLQIAGRQAARFAGHVTVEALAGACRRSQRQLQRDSRAVLDATPQQMIARVRFEWARRLLIESDRPLAQVAVDAGYADQSHLARAFASFAKMTPSTYRDQFRNSLASGADVALVQDTRPPSGSYW